MMTVHMKYAALGWLERQEDVHRKLAILRLSGEAWQRAYQAEFDRWKQAAMEPKPKKDKE